MFETVLHRPTTQELDRDTYTRKTFADLRDGLREYGDLLLLGPPGDSSGDTVAGDNIAADRITVGDISGSSGITIGRISSAHVNSGPAMISAATLFQQMYGRIAVLADGPSVIRVWLSRDHSY